MLKLRTIGWIACSLSAQFVQAQGHSDTLQVPWLQRDALDLSSDQATVLVNPFLDFSAGITPMSDQPTASFENNRGARFEAVIDSVWEVYGALQERQGAGDPLLSWWAFQFVDSAAGTVVLPSWGRTKWRNKADFSPGQALAFDGARAVGGATRRWQSAKATTAISIGLDNLHEGRGEGSVFWSRSAAPLPFISMQWTNELFRANAWFGAGIGAERGPAGATAESIFARQRIARLGVGLNPQQAVSGQMIWLRAVQVPFTHEALPLVRNWGGPELEWHNKHWSCYAAWSWDWNRLFQHSNRASPSLSRLVRLAWETQGVSMAGEWQQHFDGAAGEKDPNDLDQLPLLHAGTPIISNWGGNLNILSLYLYALPIKTSDRFSLEAASLFLSEKPLVNPLRSVNTTLNTPKNMFQVFARFQLIQDRPFFIRGGLVAVSWDVEGSEGPRHRSATYCITLAHEISKFHPLSRATPSLILNHQNP